MNVQTITIPFNETLLPVRELKAGRLKCMYEHGRLRYVKYDETEVVRMIYFAVRNKEWRTAGYTIANESIQTSDDGFSISYTALHKLDDILYEVEMNIIAQQDTISFQAKGEALSSFKKNRIGICVLHPISESHGRKVEITKPDGIAYHSQFPDSISPHQPFKEIQKLKYENNEGLTTEFCFSGDIFETEDQRNWADSTFKTYSTPLQIPFPVEVQEGEITQQSVDIHISGEALKKRNNEELVEEKLPFPKIGYAATNGEALNADEIHLLQQIPFDHYRVDLSLFHNEWEKNLFQKLDEAAQLQTKLELVLWIDEDYRHQLDEFLTSIKDNTARIVSILILQHGHPTSDPEIMEAAYVRIKEKFPRMQVGYGTDRFFAELNRNRIPATQFDFLSFSLSPQVHASDTRSVMENLQHLGDVVETIQLFSPGQKIHVSPVTFKIRTSATDEKNISLDHDPRQHRNFGAIWTLACIQNLARADRLTLYQVNGYRGILQTDNKPSELSPLYTTLKTIKSFQPKWIIRGNHNKEFIPGKIVFENDEGNRLEFVFTKGANLED